MRNLTITAVLALSLISSAPRSAVADTALGTSAWSLELGTYLGTGIGDASFAVRRHSGASTAFRFGVDVNSNDNDGDGTRTVTGAAATAAEQDNYFSNHAFSIQWMRFASIRDNVAGTFAVGPVVQLIRYGSRQEFAAGLPAFNGYESSQKETIYGLDLRLGVEWFFNSRISLGGQSGLRAAMGTSKGVNINRSGTGATYSKTETDIESDVTRITTANTKILLTAYF